MTKALKQQRRGIPATVQTSHVWEIRIHDLIWKQVFRQLVIDNPSEPLIITKEIQGEYKKNMEVIIVGELASQFFI